MSAVPAPAPVRALVWGLAVTQTVSWGILYYAFAVLLVPMQDDLGWSRSTLVGGFTLAIVVSGLVAPLVGRWLDREAARAVMTGGSVLAVATTVAWSRVDGVVAYYLVWTVVGLAMAAVLYEPAFTVLAKRTAPRHRAAITTVTLVAGLASFIFQPIESALVSHLGWRTALLVLAVVLAVVTVPIHAAVLAGGPGQRPAPLPSEVPFSFRSRRFWSLVVSFAGVTVASMATSVLLIAYLVDAGWSLGAAALAGGTLGAMQLPGRLVFGPLANAVPVPTLVAGLFCVPAVGILGLWASGGGPLVWPVVVVLGFGQGANTLLRATLFVDLYGPGSIGAVNGVSGAVITPARAIAPLAAALLVERTGGYGWAWACLIACSLGAAALAATTLASSGSERSRAPVPS